MHHSLIILLFVCQSPQVNKQSDSPRIQPLPVEITLQKKQKPLIQDAPPSTFVPPSTSFQSNQTFDPQGSFRGNAESKSATNKEAKQSGFAGGGFKQVETQTVQPLRTKPSTSNKSIQSGPPSSGFSLKDGPATSQPSNSKPASTGLDLQSDNNKGSLRIQGGSTPPIRQSDAGSTPPSSVRGTGSPAAGFQSPSSRSSNSPSSSSRSNSQSSGINPKANASSSVNQNSSNASPAIKTVVDKTFDPQLKEISDLILKSIKRPQTNRLSLAKAVSVARDAGHRKQIAKQYWTCFVTSADLQFAQQELQILKSIPNASSQLDQLLLRAAISSSEARLAETKIAYDKAASTLFKLSPVFERAQPISFADLPWTGKYKTNSTGFVQAGMFDQKIKQVDTALPAIRDLIHLRGAAVYDNLAALSQSVNGMSSGLVKMDQVLRLHEETRDQRIEFLKNIQKYNHAIADYAISVFPNANSPQVVAKMLVDTELTLPSESILDPNVRQASGNQREFRLP